MKEEIWNELYLYLFRIEIGVFKNFKECARSPCNGKHFSSLFYTSYTYNSISGYAYRGISAHIPRRDLVIFCVLRSH